MMKQFKQFIQELDIHKHKGNISAVFQAADKADDELEGPAEALVSKFIGGTKTDLRSMGFGVYAYEPLEKAHKENSQAYRDLEKAFQPVKDVIHREFGNSITLFRSEATRKASGDDKHGRTLLSYSSNPKYVEAHATGRPVKNLDVPTKDEANKAVADFRKDGEVTIKWNGVGKKRIVTDPDGEGQPDGKDWASVMDGEEIEFGDLIQDVIDGYYKDSLEWAETTKQKLGGVVVEEVPIDDIVWVSNRAYQSEFIVANKPRPRKPYLGESSLHRFKTILWAMHPVDGVKTVPVANLDDRSTHTSWFQHLGWPSSGNAFDRIPRGEATVDSGGHTVLISPSSSHTWAPEAVLDHLRLKYGLQSYKFFDNARAWANNARKDLQDSRS